MIKNLNTILAAMGAAVLLASPAMARSHHHSQGPSAEEAGAQGSAVSHRAYQAPYYAPANEGGPYTPSIREPAHGQSGDFQDGERGN